MFPEDLLVLFNDLLNVHFFFCIFSALGQFYLKDPLLDVLLELSPEVIVDLFVLNSVVKFKRNTLLDRLRGDVLNDTSKWSYSASISYHY